MRSPIEHWVQEERYTCANSLKAYTRIGWDVVEPKTDLLWNWHNSLIAEYMTAVKMGQIKRLIINEPPRNLKSIQISVMFPTWVWTTEPHTRFICTSYGKDLALKHSIDRRMMIESAWYQDRWGDVFSLASDQNAKSEFQNNKRGHMIATSMQGTATGKGCDILLVDDPHNPKRADSQKMRESDITAFDRTFTSRLDDKNSGKIVIIMQRLHQLDLTGHLLAQGGYEHLKLPAIMPDRRIISFPVSKRTIAREAESILHPEREGKPVLDEMRIRMGSATFAGQYLQEPAPVEGNIVKRKWIKFYKELPSKIDRQIQSWDMTFKASSGSAYVCGGVWARAGGDYFLIDCVRDKMDFPDSQKAVKSLSAKHPKAYRKLIEEKANGAAIMDSLRHSIGGFIPVNPDRSKEARMHGVSPMFEAGNVYFPDPSIAPWVHDFIEEIVMFPSAAFSDRVDMTTQALDDLRIAPAGDGNRKTGQTVKSTIAPLRSEEVW